MEDDMKLLNKSMLVLATGRMASTVNDPVCIFIEEKTSEQGLPSIPLDDENETYHSLEGDMITIPHDEDDELYEAAPEIIASVTTVSMMTEANKHEERDLNETSAESTADSDRNVDKDDHVADEKQNVMLMDGGDAGSTLRWVLEERGPKESVVEEEMTSFIIMNHGHDPKTTLDSDRTNETYHSLEGGPINNPLDEDEEHPHDEHPHDEKLHEAAPDIIGKVTTVSMMTEANKNEERDLNEKSAESTADSDKNVDKDDHVADQEQNVMLMDGGDARSTLRWMVEERGPKESVVEEEITSFFIINHGHDPKTTLDSDRTYCLNPTLDENTSNCNPVGFKPSVDSPETSTSTTPDSMNTVEVELSAQALKTIATIHVLNNMEPEVLHRVPPSTYCGNPYQVKILADERTFDTNVQASNGPSISFKELTDAAVVDFSKVHKISEEDWRNVPTHLDSGNGLCGGTRPFIDSFWKEGFYNPCFQGCDAHSITTCKENACQVVFDEPSASQENALEDERTFNEIVNQLRDESGIYNPDLEEITILSLDKNDEKMEPSKVVFGGVEEMPYPNVLIRPGWTPVAEDRKTCCPICSVKVKDSVLSAKFIFFIFTLMILVFCFIMRMVFDGPAPQPQHPPDLPHNGNSTPPSTMN